jgi:hypothetical protein
MTRIEPAQAQVNDVWVNGAQDHCGIVIGVWPAAVGSSSDLPTITIGQCSSNEGAGRLGVNQQDWLAFFGGHGSFYRR